MEYGIFREWFYFNDDNFTSEGELSPCIGKYSSLELAKQKLLELDIHSFREYMSINSRFMGSLSHWTYRDGQTNVSHKSIIELAETLGWDEYIKPFKDYDGQEYLELVAPEKSSDEELGKFINALGISFHKILPYQRVEKSVCAIINYKYLGDEIYFELSQLGDINYGGDLSNEYKNWGYINKKREAYSEDIIFKSQTEALKRVESLLVGMLYSYRNESFILNSKIDDLASRDKNLLKAFLSKSNSFSLSEDKNNIILNGGENIGKELMTILEFLDIKVYKIIEVEVSVDGQEIYPLYGDHQTFN